MAEQNVIGPVGRQNHREIEIFPGPVGLFGIIRHKVCRDETEQQKQQGYDSLLHDALLVIIEYLTPSRAGDTPKT